MKSNQLRTGIARPEMLSLQTWIEVQPDLKRFVGGQIRDREAVKDILQQVYIKFQEHHPAIKDPSRWRSWLFTVAHHTLIDYYRQVKRQSNLAALIVDDVPANNNDCVATVLQQLVKTLPEKYRIAIELVDMGNTSQVSLAAQLGISVAGAKSRVQRGRKLLKEKVLTYLTLKTDRYGNILTCESTQACSC